MEKQYFNEIRKIVYQQSGISLGENKEALVSARIGKRLRTLGLSDKRDYLIYLSGDSSGNELVQLLDAISTNMTSFYREPEHFDFMKEAVNDWWNKGQRSFRLWSSACSTGEEPYTMAITLEEMGLSQSCDCRILATDISTRVLDVCKSGVYEEKKLDKVPCNIRSKYFSHVKEGAEDSFMVSSSLKRMVLFKKLNLSNSPLPMKGPLDIIFCRNVMIYFDDEIRRKLLEELYRLLKPGGYLVVGHADSLTGLASSFQSVRPSIYTK